MRTSHLAAILVLARPPFAAAEFVVGAFLGASRTLEASLTIRQPGLGTAVRFDGVNYAGRPFQSPVYYGYRGGYFWERGFGLEAELIHLKVYAQTDRTVQAEGVVAGVPVRGPVPLNAVVSRFDITHGVNALLANFAVRRRVANRVFLASRFGAGVTVPHPENTVQGASLEHYQAGRPAFQVAGGGEIRLWRGLYSLGEYKFIRTRQRVDIVAGTGETTLLTHHAVFGLAWHF